MSERSKKLPMGCLPFFIPPLLLLGTSGCKNFEIIDVSSPKTENQGDNELNFRLDPKILDFEEKIAQSLAIKIETSEAKPPDVLYQVTPLNNTPGWYVCTFNMLRENDDGPQRVGLQVGKIVLYADRDVIDFVGQFVDLPDTGHTGDSESIRFFTKVGEDGKIRIYLIQIWQHNNGFWTNYSPDEFELDDGALVFYESEGKHTLYSSREECNSEHIIRLADGVSITRDYCHEASSRISIDINGLNNVGERNTPLNPFKTNPELSERYPDESPFGINGQDGKFCGGAENNGRCKASIKLWPPDGEH